MDGMLPGLLNGAGIASVLVLLILAFIKGWIYLGAVVDKLIADKDRRLDLNDQTIQSLTDSLRKYAVSAETSAHAIHELERIAAAKERRATHRDGGE